MIATLAISEMKIPYKQHDFAALYPFVPMNARVVFFPGEFLHQISWIHNLKLFVHKNGGLFWWQENSSLKHPREPSGSATFASFPPEKLRKLNREVV